MKFRNREEESRLGLLAGEVESLVREKYEANPVSAMLGKPDLLETALAMSRILIYAEGKNWTWKEAEDNEEYRRRMAPVIESYLTAGEKMQVEELQGSQKVGDVDAIIKASRPEVTTFLPLYSLSRANQNVITNLVISGKVNTREYFGGPNIYGVRDDKMAFYTTPASDGFLAGICKGDPIIDAGVREVFR